ncbi:MAG: hypothetical protein AAF439_01520 [Pseudomonadota bacterium]
MGQKHRTVKALWILAATLIAFGFLQVPSVAALNEGGQSRPVWLTAIYWIIQLTPVAPLVFVTASVLRPRPMRGITSTILAAMTATAGMVLSVAAAFFSGPASTIAFAQGLSLTTAVTATILLLSCEWEGKTKRFLGIVFAFPTAAALWSLASIAAVVFSANTHSAGQKFCIAMQAPAVPVKAFAELRGFSFYTTAGGWKLGDVWYFHRIMIVERDQGRDVYNWSTRHFEFHLLESPEHQIVSPSNVCIPKADFWDSLNIL